MKLKYSAGILMVLMMGTLAYATYNLQQTITITTGPAPVTGATSLVVSEVVPCSSGLCPGIPVIGSPGAVTFTVTSITAGWSSTGPTPTAVALRTPQSSCGDNPLGGISIPSTTGPLTVLAQSYNYCIYYATIPESATMTVTVTYAA